MKFLSIIPTGLIMNRYCGSWYVESQESLSFVTAQILFFFSLLNIK